MIEIPKLTADEAITLRAFSAEHDAVELDDLTDAGLITDEIVPGVRAITELGSAALAAYDAAERAKIRDDALEEALDVTCSEQDRERIIELRERANP